MLVLLDTDEGSLWYPENDIGITQGMIDTGKYEPDDADLLRSLLTKSLSFVDIGAHVGYFSRLAINRKCSVIAAEPSLLNFEGLKRNIGKEATIYNVAISNETKKEQRLWLSMINSGDHRIKQFDGASPDSQVVSFKKLTDIVKDRIDILKVDVQGAELKVFKGAEQYLKWAKPILLFEYSPRHLEASHKPTELLQFLEDIGYKLEPQGRLPADDSNGYLTIVGTI